MKARRFLPIQIAGYVAARLGIAALNILGFERARKVGAWLGRRLHDLDKRRRAIAADNLERAGVASGAAAADIVRRMYEHLGTMIGEMALTERLARSGKLRDVVAIENRDIFEEARARRKGVILALGHLGNWETCGVAFGMYIGEVHSVARPLDNVFLNRYLERFRKQTGQRLIHKDNAARAMLDVLRKKGTLAILFDQDARHEGVFAPFFGRPASTVKSPAVLALRYGSPIVPLNIFRENGRLYLRFTPPIEPEGHTVESLTAECNRRLEEFIRQHPEQWFWLHRRWKTQPATAVSPSPGTRGSPSGPAGTRS